MTRVEKVRKTFKHNGFNDPFSFNLSDQIFVTINWYFVLRKLRKIQMCNISNMFGHLRRTENNLIAASLHEIVVNEMVFFLEFLFKGIFCWHQKYRLRYSLNTGDNFYWLPEDPATLLTPEIQLFKTIIKSC